MTSSSAAPRVSPPLRRAGLWIGLAGLGTLLVILVAGLAWAKWLPYLDKARTLELSRSWADPTIFESAGRRGSVPSLGGAWSFTHAYFTAVWRALVVAVLVAAAVDALVPRRWLVTALDRRTPWGQSIVGGALSMPSMMCTCCTAPVAVGLRRRGAPVAASVAYWIGNPLLNPAVLVFVFLVLPWQYVAVRAVVGLVLVLGVAAFAGRLAADAGREPLVRVDDRAPAPADSDPTSLAQFPGRYSRSLLRFAVVLLPEYAVAVFALGLVSGWLSDFSGIDQRLGSFSLVVVAVIATCLVVPTGGEIPVVLAVTAAGAGSWVAGVMLIALPAVALPSVVMVGRTLGWRVTWSTAALVAAASLVAGGLVAALS